MLNFNFFFLPLLDIMLIISNRMNNLKFML
jgi:hypothetical protein